MPLRSTHLYLFVSLALSVYLILFLVPEQVQKTIFALEQKESNIEKPNAHLTLITPQSSEVIQIKASGELTSLTDTAENAFLSARAEFEKRFGNSLEDSDLPVKTIHYPFQISEGLQNMVDFWVAIFGRYGKGQYVFHNKDDVGLVYSALDLSDLGDDDELSNVATFKNKIIQEEKARIHQLLKGLAEKISKNMPLTSEEQRLANLFSKSTQISLSDAMNVENIRVQEGFSHRFKQSIVLSGQYMDKMESIFASKGLPIELTRLPFVESAFNVKALSSASASGLWQFIQPTGKLYLSIDAIADERNDPILSTYAAAQHLKDEYDLLGSWPLTINAYNTGPGRMLKAKKQLATDDIATIIKKFEDPGYQFYSRNYYPEFLAALQVYDNQEFYFGKIAKLPPQEYDHFFPPDDINLKELADTLDVPATNLSALNPALSKAALNGDLLIPRGYLVKVPKGLGKNFVLASMQAEQRRAKTQWHIVESGETLEQIATLYKTSVDTLQDLNNLFPGEELRTGTVLNIPTTTGIASAPLEDSQQEAIQ